MVSPGSPYYGGIALEMTPYDADVFVDGTYAGRVEDFDGATQPLTLSAGMHEIEVQAQGYEPMRINVELSAAGLVILGLPVGRWSLVVGRWSLSLVLGLAATNDERHIDPDHVRVGLNPDQPRRYTAQRREPPQQLQRQRKLLRSFPLSAGPSTLS